MRTLILVLLPTLLFMLLFSGCHVAEPTWHARIEGDEFALLETDGLLSREADIAHTFERPLSREVAFEILLKTDVFARVIAGGPAIRVSSGDENFGVLAPSSQSVAFHVLREETDAREVFLDLLDRGTLAGQLYGLCGLYLVDREEFHARLPKYLSEQAPVYFANGCVHAILPVSQVVQNDSDDIVGGAIPEDLDEGPWGFGGE